MIDPTIPVTCRPATGHGQVVGGPRIFIFGSARSGTTLLLNLFRTFDRTTVHDGERCVATLTADTSPDCVVVKRTPHCADHLLTDLPHIADVWIIDIIRDPRDVVTSSLDPWPGYYCDFTRWARDVRIVGALRGRHLRLVHLRFEELISRSDAMQQQLADILRLRVRVPFSSFPSVIPDDISAQTVSALGGIRPLAPDRVGRWRCDPTAQRRVVEQLRAHPSMEPLLQAMGYAPTDTEMLS